MSLIIGLVYLYKNTDTLDFVRFQEISDEERKEYSNRWYYRNLNDQQKEIYLYYAKGINDLNDNIRIKINGSLSGEQIGINVSKAIEAYSYDYPETFYVQNSYELKILNILSSKIVEIHPKYIDKDNIENMKEQMRLEIDKIKDLYSKDVTDYSKELKVHDYLVNNIQYYNEELSCIIWIDMSLCIGSDCTGNTRSKILGK